MALMVAAMPLLSATDADARRPRLPEIRMHAGNQVPVCVTPERLTAYMHSRNKNRKSRRLYKNIAHYFKKHGEKYKVRWDYAFYQSMLETNFLTYRTGSGRWGDVSFKQYNFAGIGTTGGGVPGNGFKNTSQGVLAQIQHLIAYSGEYQKNPTAPRTRLKQKDIISQSRRLRRPVRFDDLSGRWAVDRGYAKSIEWVAQRFRKKYCTGSMLLTAQKDARKNKRQLAAARAAKAAKAAKARAVQVARAQAKAQARARELAAYKARQDVRERQAGRYNPTAAGQAERLNIAREKSKALAQRAITSSKRQGNNRLSALGAANLSAFNSKPSSVSVVQANMLPPGTAAAPGPMRVKRCAVMTASYGGTKALLIKANKRNTTTYTALKVLTGFEKSMATSYIRSYARGGAMIGEFSSAKAALRKAFALCPERLAQR